MPYQATAQLSPATNVAQAIDVDNDGDLDLLGPHSGDGAATIYSNLTRHAARTSLMSQGTTTSMAVFGPPTTPWFLGVSLPAMVGLPLPPFGVLFLDPASLVVGAAGVTGATGRSDVPFAIPANPGLAGYTLAWQALMTNGLTNGFDMIVLP